MTISKDTSNLNQWTKGQVVRVITVNGQKYIRTDEDATTKDKRVLFKREKLFDGLPTNEIPERALIIFDHFSGDWDRTTKGHKLKNGWNFFYEEENVLRKGSTLPIDIVQLTDKGFENHSKK